jgi:hypothetical protein
MHRSMWARGDINLMFSFLEWNGSSALELPPTYYPMESDALIAPREGSTHPRMYKQFFERKHFAIWNRWAFTYYVQAYQF